MESDSALAGRESTSSSTRRLLRPRVDSPVRGTNRQSNFTDLIVLRPAQSTNVLSPLSSGILSENSDDFLSHVAILGVFCVQFNILYDSLVLGERFNATVVR